MEHSLELFAGAGGLGIGLAEAGFAPISAIEFDRWCCDTLRENHDFLASRFPRCKTPLWAVNETDIRNVSFEKYQGKVRVISGGPPCQPFSMGGKHRAHADQRDMFPEAVRAVRETQPKAFIFENVKGLTRSSFQNYFSYIKLQMEHPEILPRNDENWESHLARLEQHHTSTKREGLSYRVVSRLLNAADYGVPQRRERVFFVGFRDDCDVQWSFHDRIFSQEALIWDQVFGSYWDRHNVASKDRVYETRGRAISKRLSKDEKPLTNPWKTVRDVIADLPEPEVGSPEPDHRLQPGARSYPGHTGSFIDEPAKALKAGVHGVPGGENMLRRTDGSVRYFTIRESARLQTFPDGYRFHGAWSEVMRQLGNAVPSELARVVGVSVARHLRYAQ